VSDKRRISQRASGLPRFSIFFFPIFEKNEELVHVLQVCLDFLISFLRIAGVVIVWAYGERGLKAN
jgi:hypothetical protein